MEYCVLISLLITNNFAYLMTLGEQMYTILYETAKSNILW
jgi:hypothetical protein